MTQRIALLLGDRYGVGPELIAAYLARARFPAETVFSVIGDKKVLQQGATHAGVSLNVDATTTPSATGTKPYTIIHRPFDITLQPMGELSAGSGREMLTNWDFVCDLIRRKEIDALVYGPLNKQAMAMAGHDAGDELELLRIKLAPPDKTGEINILGDLWTSRVTSHVPLKDVYRYITADSIADATNLISSALKRSGVVDPKIAIAALNPHAGEGGLYGDEEINIIAPLIQKLRHSGLDINGPFPSDTVFPRAMSEPFDAVVTMFHDQGQIALKLMGLGQSITFLAGFSVPVATPGHGTAFDIAGQGIARGEALDKAISLVARMAKSKEKT